MSKDVYESFIIRSSPLTCYFQFFIYYVICKITCSSRNTHATSSSLTRTLSRIERLKILFIYFVFHCDGRAVEKTISVLCLLNLKQHFIKIFRVLVVRYATGTDNNIYCQVQRERESTKHNLLWLDPSKAFTPLRIIKKIRLKFRTALCINFLNKNSALENRLHRSFVRVSRRQNIFR